MKRFMHGSSQWPSLLVSVSSIYQSGKHLTVRQGHHDVLISYHSECTRKRWYPSFGYSFEETMWKSVKNKLVLYDRDARDKFANHLHETLQLHSYERNVHWSYPDVAPPHQPCHRLSKNGWQRMSIYRVVVWTPQVTSFVSILPWWKDIKLGNTGRPRGGGLVFLDYLYSRYWLKYCIRESVCLWYSTMRWYVITSAVDISISTRATRCGDSKTLWSTSQTRLHSSNPARSQVCDQCQMKHIWRLWQLKLQHGGHWDEWRQRHRIWTNLVRRWRRRQYLPRLMSRCIRSLPIWSIDAIQIMLPTKCAVISWNQEFSLCDLTCLPMKCCQKSLSWFRRSCWP